MNRQKFKQGFGGGFLFGFSTGTLLVLTANFLAGINYQLLCLPVALIEWFLPSFWVYSKLKTKDEKFGFLVGEFTILLFEIAIMYYLGDFHPQM